MICFFEHTISTYANNKGLSNQSLSQKIMIKPSKKSENNEKASSDTIKIDAYRKFYEADKQRNLLKKTSDSNYSKPTKKNAADKPYDDKCYRETQRKRKDDFTNLIFGYGPSGKKSHMKPYEFDTEREKKVLNEFGLHNDLTLDNGWTLEERLRYLDQSTKAN